MILEYSELEDKISLFIEKSILISNEYYNYLLLLKNTGLRPAEALNYNNVISHNQNEIIFQPNKKNLPRRLNIDQIPTLFLFYYLNHTVTYKPEKYRHYLRLFDERIIDKKYMCSGKRCSLYLFRYYYVRNLFANGMDYNDIKIHMGWNHDSLPIKYTLRNITY